ncbi:MAG: MFS transporter [Treponema sp.]|jgi:OFA family oxalate/formate antiporter-like MFS transporter|nr:MFS transporter [Treponema sp.]
MTEPEPGSSSLKRWIYLVSGVVMLLFLGLLYGWSIFRPPLTAIYPSWTAPQLSLTFTLSMIFFCLGGFFSGKIGAKVSSRVVILLSGTFLLAGFLGASRMKTEDPDLSLVMLYLCYGALCGFGVGIGYNAVIATVTRWFPDRPGMASGLLMMGFGFGGIVLGSVVNALVKAAGIFSAFFRLGILVWIVMALGSFLVKAPPSPEKAARKEDGAGYPPSRMLRTGAFWCFFAYAVVTSSAGLLVINSAATIAVAYGAPAVLGLIVGVFNGIGRLLFGAIYDRVGRRRSMLLNTGCMAAAGLCLLAGALTGGAPLIFLGLVFVGISYGGSPVMTSAVVYRFFGARHYGVNFSIANFLVVPAAFIGPMISSAILEASGGVYTPAFVMLILLAAAAFVLILGMNRAGRRFESP